MPNQRQARTRSRAGRSRPGRATPPVRLVESRGAAPSPIELQQRLGNRGAQAFLANRGVTPAPAVVNPNPPTASSSATPAVIEPQSTVSTVTPSVTAERPSDSVASQSDLQSEPTVQEQTTLVDGPEEQVTAMATVEASVVPTESTTETSIGAQPEGASSATGVTPPSGESSVTPGEGTMATDGVEPQQQEPEVPAAPNPREAIAPAISAVRNRAAGEREHRPAGIPVGSAQAAGQDQQTEQTLMAAQQTVEQLDAEKEQTEEVNRNSFKETLKQAIKDATPKPTTEAAAERVMETGARDASNVLTGEMASQHDVAAGPLQVAASPNAEIQTSSAQPNTDLELEQVGESPAPVSSAPVVPAPLSPERLNYSSDRGSTDQMMAENNVSEEQLASSNEPSFGSALETRATAEEHEATVASSYRESESAVRSQAQGGGQQALTQGLSEMHGGRSARIGLVIGEQTGTMSKNAVEQLRITNRIKAIKDKTQADVTKILDDMEKQASDEFKSGLKLAEKAYKKAFDDAKGGVGTWLTTWGDDWKEHIENALGTAREKYLAVVDKAIDKVADLVNKKLVAAKQRVTDGLKEVQDFVKELDDKVKQFGEDALSSVTADFDAMRSEVDQRRDGLVNKLTQQYKASYERMSAMEQQLREANKSLWQRVYDATVGVIQQIIAFKDMLLGILARAAAVVGSIIDDPIGFLGNLISGIKAGLDLFFGNIGEHLKNGLLGWLFGALEGAGIQIPDTFDFKGILSIIMQVLGLTYANIRKRAVGILGEEMVGRLEQVAEIFKVMVTEGPAGLWRMLMEKLTAVKDMMLEQIQNFVISEIIEAGVKWIVGLLNPAGAFIKACMMIYDIVIFFIERGRQIIELVNTIINSLATIVSGNIQAMAQAVSGTLVRILPIAISFLAALVGLGGISGKIRNIIESIQEPVNKVIDWVINKAVQLARAAGDLVAGAFGGRDEDVAETDDPEHDAKVAVGLDAIDTAEQAHLEGGEITRENAEEVAHVVKQQHPVFASLQVVDGGETWDYDYTASPRGYKTGENQAEGSEPTIITYFPGKVVADPLTSNRESGTSPGALSGWGHAQILNAAYDAWVKGHMLSQSLGGIGSSSNLSIITKSINSNMENGPEGFAKSATADGRKLYYETQWENHPKNGAIENFAKSIVVKIATYEGDDRGSMRTYSFNQSAPPSSVAGVVFNINDIGRSKIVTQFGVSHRFALTVIDARKTYGRIQNIADLNDKIIKLYDSGRIQSGTKNWIQTNISKIIAKMANDSNLEI